MVLGILLPLFLLVEAPPAQAAQPVCIPEAPVCAGLDGGGFVFTIAPPPATLSVSVTVNGLPARGSLSSYRTPTYLYGLFRPSPPLVSGDRICMTLYAGGVSPGPYCDTMP
ncbi:hypothetical protein SAMN05444920_111117 [Nonomuraea solani]|uniref:Uncharacterized protein n=1 Tax=Nonomuraea solani TaxID=1144553 RepID=A0A1H6EKP9_9ACTN|nr:hypothetical protein [Nonomuraea solani]SEG97933.1 hypothetical protein SAMN05444920_111117 [Nonomuraea solani]